MSPDKFHSSLLRRLLSGAAVVYGSGAALILLSQLLLTRLLGIEQYGIYYYALSWVAILVVLAKLGVDHAMLRFLPAYLADRNWAAMAGMLRWSSRLVGRSSLLLALGCAVVTFLLVRPERELLVTLLLGYLVLPLLAIGYLRQSAMRSLRRNVRALMPELIVAPLLIMAIVTGAKLIGNQPSAILAMAATLAAFFVALLLGNTWLRSALPSEVGVITPSLHTGDWSVSARALFIGGSMHLVMSNMDAVILGMLKGTDGVGLYGIAARTASLVAFPLTIANTAFAPMIAEMLAGGRTRDLERLLQQGMRFVALAAVTAAVILFVWGDRILGLFGAGFEAGTAFLWVLIVGQLVNALSGPVAYVVAYSGREAAVAKVLVTAAVLNAALCFLLIPYWGAMGAAISTALSLAGWNLVLYVMARRRLGISTGVIPWRGRVL